MLVRSILVMSAAAVLFPAAASAQGWRQIHSDARMNVALDTGRVTRAEDRSYTVTLRWNYSTPRRAENRREYTRMIQQVQVMCAPRIRVKRFAAAVYAANGTLVEEARPLDRNQLRYMDWDVPRAGSDGAVVYPAVCRALNSRTRRGTE